MKFYPKTLLVFFIIITTLEAVLAQADIKLSNQKSISDSRDFENFIGADENFFYTLRIKRKGKGTEYFVEKYSADKFNIVWSRDLKLGDFDGAELDPLKRDVFTYLYDDKINVIFPAKGDKKRTTDLKLISITIDGKVDNNPQTIMNSHRLAVYSMKFSDDKSKVLFVSHLRGAGGTVPNRVSVTVLNSNNNSILWTNKIQCTEEGRKIRSFKNASIYHPFEIEVSNEGSVAYSGWYFNLEDNKTDIVIHYNSKGEKESLTTVKLNTHQNLQSLTPFFNDDGDIICAGFLTDEKEKKYDNKSICKVAMLYGLIEKGDEMISNLKIKYTDYDELTDESCKMDFDFKGLVKISEGEYYFFAEESFSRHNDNGIQTFNTLSFNGDIFISKLNVNTGFEWIKHLEKSTSYNSAYTNFIFKNQKMYFLGLENQEVAENIEEGIEKFPSSNGIRYCNVRMYSVNPNGEVTSDILFNNKDFSYWPRENSVCLENSNDLLIYLQYGDKEKFGTISPISK